MIKTYIGKTCHKHPEMEGLRMVNNRQCRQCYLESKRRWAKNNRNRDKITHSIYTRLRKQNLSQLHTPIWASKEKIKFIYQSKKYGDHVDHIIPLKGICPITKRHVVCGLHVHYNLRLLSSEENDSKWAWFLVE